jgi:hypothetical protein
MLEGNKKQILKLRKELRKKLSNAGITTKEIEPKKQPAKKKIIEKATNKVIELENKPEKIVRRKRKNA